eukprot:TRINITY_DN25163_c0_g1_i1.p1 TRINITY_DN25163_c0_g1~~TRINITY_DN25163_c0_g1_i1.p1  ORF type:complete len:509 (-),score=109.59 TRINITY_DN25163_c0_g1_i1:72-1400(-)
MDEYSDGPCGHVIEYLEECGFDEFTYLLDEAEGRIREDMEAAEGDRFAFMRHTCQNGKSWMDYVSNLTPVVDEDGFVNGAWGACITAAVIFEHQNPNWSELPNYMEDGPAGQVLMYLQECGYGDEVGALEATENATHEAIDDGRKVPVFKEKYQAIAGSCNAEHVNEDPPQMTGNKKALLIGCNYPGTKAELGGCANDANAWKELLKEEYDFEDKHIRMFTDVQDDPRRVPTKANMQSGLRWLASGAQPGDVLFLQFSGHGTQVTCTDGSEEDGKNEALCPTDYSRAGVLVDDEIFDTLVSPLPSGVKLVIILDCCHSGTAVDLPYVWQTGDGNWRELTGSGFAAADVQMFSGCRDDQCSMDVSWGGSRGGAMTCCLTKAIREDPTGFEYPALLERLHEILQENGYEQVPLLTSSQAFHPESMNFNVCAGTVPNKNSVLGRS